jgi:hypothetical protein
MFLAGYEIELDQETISKEPHKSAQRRARITSRIDHRPRRWRHDDGGRHRTPERRRASARAAARRRMNDQASGFVPIRNATLQTQIQIS